MGPNKPWWEDVKQSREKEMFQGNVVDTTGHPWWEDKKELPRHDPDQVETVGDTDIPSMIERPKVRIDQDGRLYLDLPYSNNPEDPDDNWDDRKLPGVVFKNGTAQLVLDNDSVPLEHIIE